MRHSRAFTLVELLVVISIIALLIGLLLPALGAARSKSRTLACMSNMRSMEVAHWMYMNEYDGRFIDVGLSHGAEAANESVAWVNTLSKYYGSSLLHRSPADRSRHWPVEQGGAGEAVPGSGGKMRRSSYGVNNFLSRLTPWGGPYHLDNVRVPSMVVHFVYMAEEGEFAAADHTHVEGWTGSNKPARAAMNLQLNAHGGPAASWESRTNYGFLDGHAATLRFKEVFTDFTKNSFDPAVAR